MKETSNSEHSKSNVKRIPPKSIASLGEAVELMKIFVTSIRTAGKSRVREENAEGFDVALILTSMFDVHKICATPTGEGMMIFFSPLSESRRPSSSSRLEPAQK